MGFGSPSRSTRLPILHWIPYRRQFWFSRRGLSFAWGEQRSFGSMGSSRAQWRLSYRVAWLASWVVSMSGYRDHLGAFRTFFGNVGLWEWVSRVFFGFWPLVIQQAFWYPKRGGRVPRRNFWLSHWQSILHRIRHHSFTIPYRNVRGQLRCRGWKHLT